MFANHRTLDYDDVAQAFKEKYYTEEALKAIHQPVNFKLMEHKELTDDEIIAMFNSI